MTANGKIPFLDLVTPHRELEEELVSSFRTALRTAGFVGGSIVEDFEREFARYCGAQECVGVGSGTDALRFALIAAGVRPGDTVLTVPNTFIATTEAISQAGARPHFVDIDERTYTMDPAKLQEYLEFQCNIDSKSGKPVDQKTRRPVAAIIPVHLYGLMADMDPILELAERYNLIVIEDACQAHGAEYFSRKQNRFGKAGSLGSAAGFSFYPGKNLGACGEAGAVTTNDDRIAQKIRMLRDHGQDQKYCHEMEGYNGRIDAIQARILRIKLRHLPEWNRKRREKARCYDGLFGPLRDSITIPYEPPWARPVHHLYVIRARNRDQLRNYLKQANIATGIHYPIPLHLQMAYTSLGYKKGDFPAAERAALEVLSVPMYPHLQFNQQSYVVQRIFDFISMGTASLCRSDA